MNLIKESLDLYLQDKAKAEILKQKLMGKEITVNKSFTMDGNNGGTYLLTDFKFKINYVEGSNGKRIHGNNVYLVDKSKLIGGWKLIKWKFRGIEILEGKIQKMQMGLPKNLKYITGNNTFNVGLIQLLKRIIEKILMDLVCKDLDIIKPEDLTIEMDDLRFGPNFLGDNNSIKGNTTKVLEKYFIGKTFKWSPSYTRDKPDYFYYQIFRVEPVHGERYNLCSYVRKNSPYPGVELFPDKSDAIEEIKKLGTKYFGVALDLKQV